MIFGVGTDLCTVARMAEKLEKEAFVHRVFSPQEQEFWQSRKGTARAESAAADFAAKEAFLKAAGVGLSGFALNEIAALRKESGAPYYKFSGEALRWVEANGLTAHLSLTHEGGLAAAVAVLERRVAEE